MILASPDSSLHPAGVRGADELIDQCAVKTESRSSSVASLSGGNQQKVVLGRAFASHPKVLVLDTPTAGVDVVSTEAVFDSVRASAKHGLAVLIISQHHLGAPGMRRSSRHVRRSDHQVILK